MVLIEVHASGVMTASGRCYLRIYITFGLVLKAGLCLPALTRKGMAILCKMQKEAYTVNKSRSYRIAELYPATEDLGDIISLVDWSWERWA